jgi:hypothetical protein
MTTARGGIRAIKGEQEMITDEMMDGGLIFDEFPNLGLAKGFASHIEKEFGLGAKVFDDVEAAYAAHHYPFTLRAPVVIIERPTRVDEDPNASWLKHLTFEKIAAGAATLSGPVNRPLSFVHLIFESAVEALAPKFGGELAGT